jgi:hypothetical protein
MSDHVLYVAVGSAVAFLVRRALWRAFKGR